MKCNNKVYAAFLCFWMISGVPLGSMAAGIPGPPTGLAIDGTTMEPIPPPTSVTPPGNDGLLSGLTPGNYKIPSGWSLLRTQDFEGAMPTGETWGSSTSSVTTTRPHLGSKSIEGNYAWDGASTRWILNGSYVGSYTEVYLSFYEYIESQALFNDELFIANFYVRDPYQEVIADWFWAPGFNQPNATLYVVSQGVRSKRAAPKSAAVPKGAWVQWEIHYRPNTSGNSNGFYRVYKDGVLFTSAENADLNGTRSMTNVNVQAGGVYTKLIWMTDYPTCSIPSGCSAAPGTGTDLCRNKMGWYGQLFTNPKCNPIDPPLPTFKRYLDDIIVMKK